MTRYEARLAIARKYGAEVTGQYDGHTVVRFFDDRKADECKAVLDALDPDFTGEVFGVCRLLIADPDWGTANV